jgi:hypothetical protein
MARPGLVLIDDASWTRGQRRLTIGGKGEKEPKREAKAVREDILWRNGERGRAQLLTLIFQVGRVCPPARKWLKPFEAF